MVVSLGGRHRWFLAALLASYALAAVAASPSVAARGGDRTGTLDRSFGSNGRLVAEGGRKEGQVQHPATQAEMAMAGAPSGRFVAATSRRLFSFRGNGRPHRGFGVDGVRIEAPQGWRLLLADAAVDSQGRILVGGTLVSSTAASTPGPPNFPDALGPRPASAAIYRYLPSGQLDQSFGTGGLLVSSFDQLPPVGPGPYAERYGTASVSLSGLAVTDDDSVVVVGSSVKHVAGCHPGRTAFESRAYVGRLTPDGRPETGFGTSGVVTDEEFELVPSGPVIGETGQIAYTIRSGPLCSRVPMPQATSLSMLTSGGFLFRRTQVTGPPEISLDVTAIALDRRGRILLLVNQYNPWHDSETGRTSVRRLLSNGSPDLSFGRRGSVTPKLGQEARLLDLAADRRGQAILVGTALTRSGNKGFLLMRLSTAGKIDRGFGRRGQTRTGFGGRTSAAASEVSLDDRGRILLGGSLTEPRSVADHRLAFARYRAGNR